MRFHMIGHARRARITFLTLGAALLLAGCTGNFFNPPAIGEYPIPASGGSFAIAPAGGYSGTMTVGKGGDGYITFGSSNTAPTGVQPLSAGRHLKSGTTQTPVYYFSGVTTLNTQWGSAPTFTVTFPTAPAANSYWYMASIDSINP